MSRDMQDVELLDGDELDGHRADADAAAVHADRRRAVWRWRVVAGVLVVGAGLLGVQAFVDARERAVLAELAGVDGVVRPLGGTLEATALTSQEVDDLRLDAQPGLLAAEIRTVADGPQAIVSTRVDSGGQPRWSIPVLGLGPRPTDEAAPFTVLSRCVASADGPGTAVCLVSDGYVTYSDDGPVAAMSPVTTSEVVVVDTDHGRVVSRWATEPAHVVASLPGLVVTGFADPPAGVVTVVAHDGRTGVERWRYAVPFAEGEDVAGWVEYGSLYTAGDLVVVVSARSITLLDADGRLVRDDLGGHDLGVSYGYLWGSTLRVSSTSATGDVTTTVVAADGDPDADRVYRGDAVVTTVDDGSVPGLFLTMSAGAMSLAEQMGDEPATSGAGPGLRAYDSATGQELWRVRIPSSSAGPSTSGAIVLRGRVYVASPSSAVVAIDARTGRVVWSAAEGPGPVEGVVTDGRSVFAASTRSHDGRRGRWLVGRDLDTGAERWSAPLPDGVDVLTVIDHTLLGMAYSTGERTELG